MHDKINPYARLGLRRQIYMEARAMAEHASATGKGVSADIIKTIDSFADEFLERPIQTDNSSSVEKKDIAPLVDVHKELVKIVHPASPQTLLLLDLEQEVPMASFWRLFGPVALIRQMMLITIISLVTFITLMMFRNPGTDWGSILELSGFELLRVLLFFLSCAALGACVTALYKANSYITDYTFNPTHQASYWIRFALGLISGLLLAIIVTDEALQDLTFLEPGSGRIVLAIIGGFSSDFVYTLLNRIVETLRSLFQGNMDSMLKQKVQEAQIQAAGKIEQTRQKVAADLLTFQQSLGKDIPDEIHEQLNKMVTKMMSREDEQGV